MISKLTAVLLAAMMLLAQPAYAQQKTWYAVAADNFSIGYASSTSRYDALIGARKMCREANPTGAQCRAYIATTERVLIVVSCRIINNKGGEMTGGQAASSNKDLVDARNAAMIWMNQAADRLHRDILAGSCVDRIVMIDGVVVKTKAIPGLKRPTPSS